ncbi:MAG: amidase family protein, partial [Proteobacteria bacterium]|nr:amidase family protein [Pseudomonadota bacterium]
FHIGSDGGGSIRIPASFTGTFGFKASYGRIPNSPVAPNGRIGHLGPQTRTVDDAALLYRVLAGPDDRDPHSLPAEMIPEGDLAPLEGLRIGWVPDLGFLKADAQVVRICEQAVQKFADARCTIVPLKINIEDPLDTTIGIAIRAGIGGVVTGFPDWRERIDPGLGEVIDAAEKNMSPFSLADAALGIGRIWDGMRRQFAKIDILALPTTPTVAFPVGQNAPTRWLKQPEGAMRWFGMTAAFNATGQPAASLPAGFTRAGLPVGLQLVGQRYGDWSVLRACKTFEMLAPWADKWPKIAQR